MITLAFIVLAVGSLYAAYRLMEEKLKARNEARRKTEYFKNLPPDDFQGDLFNS